MRTLSRVLAGVAALCAACSSRATRQEGRPGLEPPPPGDQRAFAVNIPASARVAEFAAPDPLALPDARAVPPADSASSARMLVLSARASLEVDSVAPAALRLRRLSEDLGGFIAGSSAQMGTDRVHSADYEVRVPSSRFDEFLDRVRRIGRLAALQVSSEDVGEQYVDVEARLRNSGRLETRLLALLGTSTGRLRDVLEIERALASVREDIERLEGRVRYLRHSVAMSTLSVTLREPQASVAGAPGAVALSGAFHQAWDNFLWLTTVAIQALGVILPLTLVVLAGWAVRRRLRANVRPARAVQ
jgi:hypothetical protein